MRGASQPRRSCAAWLAFRPATGKITAGCCEGTCMSLPARLLALFVFAIVGLSQGARADQCDPLKPTPPQNISQEIVGKFEAKVDGLARRLVTVGGNIDGTFREVTKDVLKEYPNADRLYMWARTLYLFCVTVSGSRL